MGLAIEVGMLSDMKGHDPEGLEYYGLQFSLINDYLRAEGLPQHDEPLECEVWSTSMFGYSGLHYLRRAAAHLHLAGQLPQPGDSDAAHDSVLERYYNFERHQGQSGWIPSLLGKTTRARPTFDHLIFHSDVEGYYLPLDFEEVLFPAEDIEIAGAMIGSAPRLLFECRQLASALKIPLEVRADSDELWEAADSQGEGDQRWQRYGVESFSCVALIEACEQVQKTGAALVFC